MTSGAVVRGCVPARDMALHALCLGRVPFAHKRSPTELIASRQCLVQLMRGGNKPGQAPGWAYHTLGGGVTCPKAAQQSGQLQSSISAAAMPEIRLPHPPIPNSVWSPNLLSGHNIVKTAKGPAPMYCNAWQHWRAADKKLARRNPLGCEKFLFLVVLFGPVYTPVELSLQAGPSQPGMPLYSFGSCPTACNANQCSVCCISASAFGAWLLPLAVERRG